MSTLPMTSRSRAIRSLCCAVAAGCAAASVQALTVTVDYSYDSLGGSLFTRFPEARAAMDQAAADVSALIATNPTAISEDYFLGRSGSAEIAFDLDLLYQNPSFVFTHEVRNPPFVAAGEVIIYAGSRSLAGNSLGFSEVSTVRNTMVSQGGGTPTEKQAATGIAAADAEAVWRRGPDGPVMNTLSGPSILGGDTVDFIARMGMVAASVWFDVDTNNNSAPDSDAQLAAFWHFDHTTPPPPDKFDFYTTALHEMVHGLGIGTAQSFTELNHLTEGGEPYWLGATGRWLNGNMFGITDEDGRHLAAGLMSPRLSDGVLQEALLSHDIQAGVRKEITLIDAAILQDIGWTLTNPIPVPEPSALLWLGLLLGFRRRRPNA